MLETCKDIVDCEKLIEQSLQNYKFIGQIGFSQDDINKLEELIRQQFERDSDQYLTYLMDVVPSCLALYMVGKGVWEYQKGNYWPQLEEAIPSVCNTNIQQRLGSFFLNYIKTKNFEDCQVFGAYRYVTSILLQGGIPNHCLTDFFNLVSSHFVYKNLTERIEIRDALYQLKCKELAYEQERESIENKLELLYRTKNEVNQKIEITAKVSDLKLNISELKEKKRMGKDWLHLPVDVDAYRLFLQQEIAESEIKIKSLQQERKNLLQIAWHYQLPEEKIITRGPEIIWYQKNLPEIKCMQKKLLAAGRMREAALAGSLPSNVTLHPNYIAFKKNIGEVIDDLKRWYSRIADLACAVNVEMCSYETTLQILLGKLNEALEKRNKAVKANDQLSFSIEPALKGEVEKLHNRKAELREIDQILLELGQGDLDLGIEELAYYRRAPMELQNLCCQLQQLIKELPSALSLYDLQELGCLLESFCVKKQKIEEECRQLTEELEILSPVLGYRDEPVRRFLIYGGTWAEDWVCDVVSLLLTYPQGEDGSTKYKGLLPQRIIKRFFEWRKHESNNGTQNNAPPEEELNLPYLSLNTALFRLEIIIPSQIFTTDTSQHAEVLLRYDGLQKSIQLPLYKQANGSVITNEQKLVVERFAPEYEVFFTCGNKNICWKIDGLQDDFPFFCFQETGKSCGAELLYGCCWVILRDGFYLQPGSPVIEERELYLSGEYYALLLMDFQHTACLNLICDDGSALIVPCHPHGAPRLSGGKVVPSVSINGEPLYATFPSLIMPFQDEAESCEWEVSLYEISSQQVWHFFFEDLKKLGSFSATGEFIMLLDMTELTGGDPFGEYKLHLESRCSSRHYSFNINIIPELLVIFEPETFPLRCDSSDALTLTVILPENHKLDWLEPGSLIIQEDDAYEYRIEPDIDTVRCCISDNNERKIFLVIEVPKIWWRLIESRNVGSLWSNQVGCFCFDDFRSAYDLFLEISIPPHLADFVAIQHPDSGQKVAAHLVGGRAKIDILAFLDTLAQQQLEFIKTELQIYLFKRNKCVYEGVLWEVILQWHVFDVKYKFQNQGLSWSIDFSWQEEGRTDNGLLLLGSFWEPWKEPLIYQVEPGITSQQFNIEKHDLPPGKYLVQFVEEDPWGGAEIFSPNLGNYENELELILIDDRLFLEALWTEKDAYNLYIHGKFTRTIEEPVQVALLSVSKGKQTAVIKEDAVDNNGNFTVVFDQTDFHGDISCRWVGVMVAGEGPYYRFLILDCQPAPLELKLTKGLQKFLQGEDYTFSLSLVSKEHVFADIILSDDCARKVIKNPNQAIEDKVLINNEVRTVRLEPNRSGDYTISLGSSVLCLGCGAILPNQQAWYDHSNPYTHPQCKCLKLNFGQVNAALYLSWNIDLLPDLQNTYPILNYLVLYDSITLPCPDFPRVDCFEELNIKSLIKKLIKKEIHLFKIWKERMN